MKTLLIIGNDAVSSWLGNRIFTEGINNVKLFIDRSNNLKRVIRLLIQRRLPLRTAIKIYIAELKRQRHKIKADGFIDCNNDLVKMIKELNPEKIICFRCGLIISSTVLKLGVPTFNIHVADLPAFPGLGAIERSIAAKIWGQNACLHYIDTGIDTGKVLLKKKYLMKADNSYKENEDIAYKTGIDLVVEFLKGRAN